jgi:hypothetical protein
MEDRETARMRKYGESKTTRIMMATVPHGTSGLGLRKFQADGFLLTRVYSRIDIVSGKARFRDGDIDLCCTKVQIFVIYR